MLLYDLLARPITPYLVNQPGFVAPAAPLALEDRESLAAGAHWRIDGPVAVMYGVRAQEHWDISDFTDLRLPAPSLACEFDAPGTVKSVVHGPSSLAGTSRARFLVWLQEGPMPPEGIPDDAAGIWRAEPGDRLLLIEVFASGTSLALARQGARAALRLTRAGRPMPWADGRAYQAIVGLPGGVKAPLTEHVKNRAVQQVEFGLFTAGFAVNAFNTNQASLHGPSAADRSAWQTATNHLTVRPSMPEDVTMP